MRCVVTGGSGFIGSHVVEQLLGAGHEVTIVDTRPPEGNVIRHFDANIRDVERLTGIFRQHGRDTVFHIAAVANARESLADPVTSMDINVGGTACVLEAAKRAEVSRVILASTVWVFNAVDQTPPAGVENGAIRYLTETEPFLPNGSGHIYTTSKIASELLCHDYHRLFGLNFTILRYGIPYGPRMWPGLALRSFIENAFDGKPIRIFGDGSAVRRFIFVGDLARAHVLATKEIGKNQTYSLEGDHDITIRELAETVARFIPNVQIEYVVDPARRGELALNGVVISNQKAKDELGWAATADLQDGVRRVVDWYENTYRKPKRLGTRASK